MSFPRMLLIGSIALFGVIGTTKVIKKFRTPTQEKAQEVAELQASPAQQEQHKEEMKPFEQVAALPQTPVFAQTSPQEGKSAEPAVLAEPVDGFPQCDRIQQLFSPGANKLPIVETITYTSHVPWLKGRPAWVGDYAQYYKTSRHFIARSLNKKADYFSQKVAPGQKFNVFKKGKNLQFHLLVDLSRRQMGFYYIDLDANQRVLLKTYKVGVGKLDDSKESGSLTPLGKFSLDSRVAVNKPGDMGYFQGQKVEVVNVFGSRWIPIKDVLEGATGSHRGIGLQGAPWEKQGEGKYIERRDTVGEYVSGGCIRLYREDIEELFSIVISKPTVLEIVQDFRLAKLPGIEERFEQDQIVEVETTPTPANQK